VADRDRQGITYRTIDICPQAQAERPDVQVHRTAVTADMDLTVSPGSDNIDIAPWMFMHNSILPISHSFKQVS
jgi:hypothetical protein